MTTLTHDPDHQIRGVARMIERYRRPRTSALLASWLGEVQSVEDALWQLLIERSLATAEGAQLDVLGAIVGEPRQGRDDETYRLWISARTMVSRSSGTTTEILAIARKLIPADRGIRLEEYYPAAMLVRVVGGVLTIDDGYQIARMLHLAKAAGVLFGMTWSVVDDAGTFAFAPVVDVPVLDSPIGFDAGVWAVVADGTYLPPTTDTLPGQLLIQGRPLVIGGVPLVITPDAPALANQITLGGMSVVYLGEPLVVTPGG
jgi:hypothetical protein